MISFKTLNILKRFHTWFNNRPLYVKRLVIALFICLALFFVIDKIFPVHTDIL